MTDDDEQRRNHLATLREMLADLEHRLTLQREYEEAHPETAHIVSMRHIERLQQHRALCWALEQLTGEKHEKS